MKKVANDSTVTVNYTGRLEDGTVFDSSMVEGREPLKTKLGQGQLIKGFEDGLVDMEVGQTKTIEIPANEAYGEYLAYIVNFIDNMNNVFEFGNDWGMYVPEVKYLSPEPLVNYTDLSLNEFPNVHFAGDALSARGITVSGAHGIYIAENLIK